MKAAEYLTKRGWVGAGDMWSDPQLDALRIVEDAITIQRARDEEKCHEAWVRFAAAAMTDGAPSASLCEVLAASADAMLRLYRARFCPEVES